MSLLGVGAEDGEDGGLLARLGQQLVDQNLPLGEAELRPCLALVGAEPGVGRRTVLTQPPSPPPHPVPGRTYLRWAVAPPCLMAIRMPPWSPHV